MLVRNWIGVTASATVTFFEIVAVDADTLTTTVSAGTPPDVPGKDTTFMPEITPSDAAVAGSVIVLVEIVAVPVVAMTGFWLLL